MVGQARLMAAVFVLGAAVLVAKAITRASPMDLLILVPVPAILGYGGYRLYQLRGERRIWETYALPEVAMRMSRAGLTLNSDRMPRSVFLPWHTVTGFSVHGRGYSVSARSLVVYLAAGVDASTPGTARLDQPEVLPMLRPRFGQPGFRYLVGALRPLVPVIDQALAHYTDGQLRIRPLV